MSDFRFQPWPGTIAITTLLAPVFDTNRTLEEMTRELVEIALRRVHGNQSQAAVQLGVSRSTLWRMLHKEK